MRTFTSYLLLSAFNSAFIYVCTFHFFEYVCGFGWFIFASLRSVAGARIHTNTHGRALATGMFPAVNSNSDKSKYVYCMREMQRKRLIVRCA